MKVWEARSLVRIAWPATPESAGLRVAKVEAATLALTSASTLTFSLGDMASAISVGAQQKAFEVGSPLRVNACTQAPCMRRRPPARVSGVACTCLVARTRG